MPNPRHAAHGMRGDGRKTPTWGSCALVAMTTTAQGRVYCEKPITFVLRVIASELKNAVRPSSRARTLSPRVAYLRTARDIGHDNTPSLLRISDDKLPRGFIYII